LNSDLELAVDRMSEGLTEEGDSRTQLQEIIDFFYKKQPEMSGASAEDYEALEMVVEKLSSQIDDLRANKEQKKAHLNLEFNKYELMKSELEMFFLEQEDRKNLDYSVLNTTLYTTEAEKASLLEERRRLEEDLTRSLINDRRKRATREDLKNLKKQFKESVAFYDIYGFKKSNGSQYILQQEEKWKRLLLEYANLTNRSIQLANAIKEDSHNIELKDELDFINQQLVKIEERIHSSRRSLDIDNQELDQIFIDLKIDPENKLDKGYSMTTDEVISLAKGENADKRKVALAYVNYKMYHDPKYLQSESFTELYDVLYQKLKATINAFVTEYENDKEKIEACYQEFMMATSILCSLTDIDEYAETLFDREENSKLLVEFFQCLNANDNELRDQGVWPICMDMCFAFVRYLYQGHKQGYPITQDDAVKTILTLYINKREYEPAVVYRSESRQFLLACLILGVNHWANWFATERDTFMKTVLEDLSIGSLELTNQFCLGALIYLGIIDGYKKFKIPVEQELTRLESKYSKEPLWM